MKTLKLEQGYFVRKSAWMGKRCTSCHFGKDVCPYMIMCMGSKKSMPCWPMKYLVKVEKPEGEVWEWKKPEYKYVVEEEEQMDIYDVKKVDRGVKVGN